MNLEERVLNLPAMHKGLALTPLEIANRLQTDLEPTRDACRKLRAHRKLQSGLRGNGKAEYWLPKDGMRWIKRAWLRPTGMELAKAYRQSVGDFVK